MKIIATIGLIVSLALPAHAQDEGVFSAPVLAQCSYDFGVFNEVYGNDISPIIDPMDNGNGYGLIVAESSTHEVVFMVMPDGAWCVIWDSIIPGEPA